MVLFDKSWACCAAREGRGMRTAWHTHPRGQTLIVTAACIRVQREGGLVEEIRPGDGVWLLPDEKHGQSMPTTAMTHIAIQENLTGQVVGGVKGVRDQQCRKGPDQRSWTWIMNERSSVRPPKLVMRFVTV